MTNKNLFLSLVISLSVIVGSFSTKIFFCVLVMIFYFFVLNQHVTLALIQLELMTLLSSLIMILFLSLLSSSIIFTMTLLMVGVLEGTAGLSLLALSSRVYSAELFKFQL